MSPSTPISGTLWVTTHRFVFLCQSTRTLFEVPLEIFVKESYTGGFFQSGHRVKIKRDGSKTPNIYDSNVLSIMIQNIAGAKAEELKIDPAVIEEEYRSLMSIRDFPSKITFMCPNKTVRNRLKKVIDDAVNREEWTKVKFDINKFIRKSDIGIANIMGRQKEKDQVMSNKISVTSSDINQLSSTAQELITIADEIK